MDNILGLRKIKNVSIEKLQRKDWRRLAKQVMAKVAISHLIASKPMNEKIKDSSRALKKN